MVQILAVTARAHFRGLPDEGRDGLVRPGDELLVTKARAMALKANRLIEGEFRMPGDKKVNVPVFTVEESFQDETWNPEIAEERARMVQGDAPESPLPNTKPVAASDPDLARPVTPAQGGFTAEKMTTGDQLLKDKAEPSKAARERDGTFDPATPITPATGGGEPPELMSEGVTEASFERYATPVDATNREVTRGEVAQRDEKLRRGRPPKARPVEEQKIEVPSRLDVPTNEDRPVEREAPKSKGKSENE